MACQIAFVDIGVFPSVLGWVGIEKCPHPSGVKASKIGVAQRFT
ncbi:hypothetical protein HMPREF3198_01017 [Winkia neuii]|nr:hypothetical protein HMPREF3198_01017 [Winkia neuii]